MWKNWHTKCTAELAIGDHPEFYNEVVITHSNPTTGALLRGAQVTSTFCKQLYFMYAMSKPQHVKFYQVTKSALCILSSEMHNYRKHREQTMVA